MVVRRLPNLSGFSFESDRRRDWDVQVLHPRTVRLVASRRTRHSRSVRHRQCVHVLGRLVADSLRRRTFCPSTKDMRRCQSIVTCRRAWRHRECQQQKGACSKREKSVFLFSRARGTNAMRRWRGRCQTFSRLEKRPDSPQDCKSVSRPVKYCLCVASRSRPVMSGHDRLWPVRFWPKLVFSVLAFFDQ